MTATSEVTRCNPEAIVTRDLADMASTAGDLAISIKHASKWLGEAYEDGTDERVGPAVAELKRARAGLDELIEELETLR